MLYKLQFTIANLVQILGFKLCEMKTVHLLISVP